MGYEFRIGAHAHALSVMWMMMMIMMTVLMMVMATFDGAAMFGYVLVGVHETTRGMLVCCVGLVLLLLLLLGS